MLNIHRIYPRIARSVLVAIFLTTIQIISPVVNATAVSLASSTDVSHFSIPSIKNDATEWNLHRNSIDKDTANWTSITYGNGTFVAVAKNSTGNQIVISGDGINWTPQNGAHSLPNYRTLWNSVTFGNGVFVAVGSARIVGNEIGNAVMTSPDGVNWSPQSIPDPANNGNNNLNAVTFGGGKFVAVGNSGTNRALTSTDGVTWTAPATAVNRTYLSLAYGDGTFVGLTSSGGFVLKSTDGGTTFTQTAGINREWRSITYGRGLFVAVATNTVNTSANNTAMTSPDGITWTERATPTASLSTGERTISVAYGNGIFAAVASTSTGISDRVMTSLDGITWALQTSPLDTKNANPISISSVLPASGSAAGGTTVQITGVGFTDLTTVTIGGIAASVTFNSSTSLTVVTPSGVVGASNVAVKYGDSKAISTGAFTYTGTTPSVNQFLPTFSSISPASGHLSGGTSVTISGTGFVSGASVTFGGIPATSVIFNSSNSITATAPAGTLSSVDVVVTNPDNGVATGTMAFDFTSDNNWKAITYGNGKFVAISGSNFGTNHILVGLNDSLIDTVNHTITILAPAGTSRTSLTPNISLLASGASIAPASGVAQNFTSPVTYTVTAQDSTVQVWTVAVKLRPSITSISPSNGNTAGGTPITITGTGFLAGATVTIGGITATNILINSPTEISAVTPAGAGGSVDVVVTNPDTGSVTQSRAYLYGSLALPSYISIAPSSGLPDGGTNVIISGTGFVSGATVKFGGVSATGVVVNSPTQITAVTPVGSNGSANLLITNPNNDSVTATNVFTYIAGLIQPAGVGGSDWTFKCPTVIDTEGTTQPQTFGFTFDATGQVFSRLVNGGYTAVTSTDSLVGCYANLWDFNIDPVGTNGWQIGTINRDANGYFWRQAEGSVWRLTLSGSLLNTDNANPYFSRGNSFIFLSAPAVTRAATVDPALAARNQAAVELAARMVRESAMKSQIAENLQSGSTLTLEQLTGAGLKSLSNLSLTQINTELALMPIDKRDVSAVTQLVNLYSVVEKVATTQKFYINDLVQVGLVPALDPDRSSIVRFLKSLPVEARDTPAEIAAAIATTKKRSADRKAALQAILARKKTPTRS